jgi:two-component system, OmpR family, KDP operon response regulator KdpE
MARFALASRRQAVIDRIESTFGELTRGDDVVRATDSAELLAVALDGQVTLILMDMRSYADVGVPLIKILGDCIEAPVVALVDEADADPSPLLEAGAVEVVSLAAPRTELVSRVRAAAERVKRQGAVDVVRVGDLAFDLRTGDVAFGGSQIHLTRTEAAVLRVLIANRGRVVSDQDLLETVWGPEYTDAIEYVRVYVGYLRSKIDRRCTCAPACRDSYITRVRSRGYRFEPAHRHGAMERELAAG